ncbi:hypothetical protein LEN26_005900 [Aphanomyces euteiches]|nr:hypothetical protein AeMF1_021572 [Aphanomyces euteiches]KAH9137184.1 hypothetical protein LEN26_005900 [Aphanomyces euteiches]
MPLELQSIQVAIEASVEELLRIADTKINWPSSFDATQKGYFVLPGVYTYEATKSALPEPVPVETPTPQSDQEPTEATDAPDQAEKPTESGPADEPTVPPAVDTEEESVPAVEEPPAKPVDSVAAFLLSEDDVACISYTLTLHGDNTFEYMWKQTKTGSRPMEHYVELTGHWHKPILNRDRYGERDQRLFLETSRARFHRLANFDAATNTWKQTLRTLTRHGEDWVTCGEHDRGLPPIRMVFHVLDNNVLESIGGVFPHEIVSNAIPSRILSGLTKKAGTKLGTPIDVMTDKWLPCAKLCLGRVLDRDVKPFNPLICLAEALRKRRKVQST